MSELLSKQCIPCTIGAEPLPEKMRDELLAPFPEPIKVKALGLPKGAVIGAVIHDDSVKIARGDTTIHRGDRVILFVLPGTHEAIEKLFRD